MEGAELPVPNRSSPTFWMVLLFAAFFHRSSNSFIFLLYAVFFLIPLMGGRRLLTVPCSEWDIISWKSLRKRKYFTVSLLYSYRFSRHSMLIHWLAHVMWIEPWHETGNRYCTWSENTVEGGMVLSLKSQRLFQNLRSFCFAIWLYCSLWASHCMLHVTVE